MPPIGIEAGQAVGIQPSEAGIGGRHQETLAEAYGYVAGRSNGQAAPEEQAPPIDDAGAKFGLQRRQVELGALAGHDRRHDYLAPGVVGQPEHVGR